MTTLTAAPTTWADVEPLRKDRGLDSSRRTIKTEWVLDEHDGTDAGQPAKIATVVTLHSYHLKEGKAYWAILSYAQRRKRADSPFVVEAFAPFSQASVKVAGTHVGRYSAKTLEEFHDAALDLMDQNFDQVRRVFTEAYDRRNNRED